MTDGASITPIGAARKRQRERPLDRGDHAELAGMLLADLESCGEVTCIGTALSLDGRRLTPAELSRVVQAYAGLPVVTRCGGTRPLCIRESDVRGVVSFARALAEGGPR